MNGILQETYPGQMHSQFTLPTSIQLPVRLPLYSSNCISTKHFGPHGQWIMEVQRPCSGEDFPFFWPLVLFQWGRLCHSAAVGVLTREALTPNTPALCICVSICCLPNAAASVAPTYWQRGWLWIFYEQHSFLEFAGGYM